MPDDFYPICGVIVLAGIVVVCATYLLEHWLVKTKRLPPSLKVQKIKRQRYEPLPPQGKRIYPDAREEVISQETISNSQKI